MTSRHHALVFAAVALLAAGAVWSAGRTGTAKPPAPDTLAVVADTTLPHRVIVYYLHTKYRCPTCRRIEAFTKEAVETGFPEQLKSGLLVWRSLDYEEKANAHFVKDYGLYTKSVILIDERFGRQKSWKNLSAIWELNGDRNAFIKYIQDQTKAYLGAS